MQTETPPKQAALARQVRQRMNRLGKPEHRARFCFFSKKKSLAGTRRFPLPSKSRFGWGLTAAPQSPQPQKRWHCRKHALCATTPTGIITAQRPAMLARRLALCATTPPQATAFAARSASSRPLELPLARMRRARAGFQSAARYSKSMPRPPHEGCKRKRRPNRRLGAASAAKDEPAREARAPRALLLLSKKKSLAGMRRFPIPSKSRFRWALTAVLSILAAPKTLLQSPPLAGAKRHRARWNHRRRTPAMLAHQPALAPPHPLKPPHLPPASHHRAPRSHFHCAHAQGQSRVRACRTVLEEHAAPAA